MRNNNLRLVNKQEMQKIQLDILDDIHQFCTANNIRYSLAYGTLLGAVRHKGYIPWDDDIDLIMPRKDYERFIKEYSSDCNEVLDLSKSDVCKELFVKVSRKNTIMKDCLLGRELWGINVDIFPVDNATDNYKELLNKYYKLKKRLNRVCPYYKGAEYKKISMFFKNIIKRIVFLYPYNILRIKKQINDLIYTSEETTKAGVLFDGYWDKEFFDKEIFEKYSTILFEGKYYNSVSDYDKFLSQIYGDYMQLPPEEQRKTNHLYEAYVIE
ncbi:MAG: LicD family protein [Candidatus Cryptobacteroides sp.]